MKNNFTDDFYVFATPKDNPESNSYIKIIDIGCEFAGVVFCVNKIKLRKRWFRGYTLNYDYTIIDPPENNEANLTDGVFDKLVGDIVVDVWEKYYA